MREIVEEALSKEGGTPPGEVRDVQVAVVGVGATGTERLAGIARRLRADAFVGQLPWDIDPVVVDLPGTETDVAGWEPVARHTVERLDRDDRGDDVRLGPEETRRMRRFGGDGLARYDAVVLTLDGTDPAVVSVGSALAAAFRGGIAEPVLAVATFPADDPPVPLVGDEDGWRSDARATFGPDAVVPVEHGRATELVDDTEGSDLGTARDPVETAAEDVTAALAEALGTRTQFGSLAADLHRLRGWLRVHVGRQGSDHAPDAETLVDDAVSTPLAGTPPGWESGGPWLGHLRTPSPEDEDVEAVMERIGATLAGRADAAPTDTPAGLESYRLRDTDPHELFLFRVSRPDCPDAEPPHADTGSLDIDDLGLGGEVPREELDLGGEEEGNGFDVVR